MEKEVDKLITDINESLEKTCPKKSAYGVCPRKASRIKNWWDPAAENAREISNETQTGISKLDKRKEKIL